MAHVIDTARWAPSSGNQQPVRWLVVEKPEEVRRLAGLVAEVPRPSQVSYLKGVVDAWDQGMDHILCKVRPGHHNGGRNQNAFAKVRV